MHQWDGAIAAAQKAIALKPDFQLAKNNLAWSLSQKRLGGR
jgi:protein O-mannosyl-transferase